MARDLFICNTVYQTMISLWMKYKSLCSEESDIIISDHMNNSERIYNNIKNIGLFNNCFYVKSFQYSRGRVESGIFQRFYSDVFPEKRLNEFLCIEKKYDNLFIANMDDFSLLCFRSIIKKNKNISVHIFEDGISTYSCIFEEYVRFRHKPSIKSIRDFIRFARTLSNFIPNTNYLSDYINDYFVFEPELMIWDPGVPVYALEKINIRDNAFKSLCNTIFDYTNDDSYIQKYIFLEESFYSEGIEVNDLDIILELSKRIGKNNIIVKIHPRNKTNRFKKEGFKTNNNTGIPWELIVMNMGNIEDKVLITVFSSCVITPKIIFDLDTKVFSIYKLVCSDIARSNGIDPRIMQVIKKFFTQYPSKYRVVDSLDEIN